MNKDGFTVEIEIIMCNFWQGEQLPIFGVLNTKMRLGEMFKIINCSRNELWL